MPDTVKNLTERVKRAHDNTVQALLADLREARIRSQNPSNPRRAQDKAIFERILQELIRANIVAFNSIVDSALMKANVDIVTKEASKLKKEAAKIKEIADNITKWSTRIDFAAGIITKLIAFA